VQLKERQETRKNLVAGATLEELAGQLPIKASTSVVYREPQHLKITYQKTLQTAEQDRPDVAQQRNDESPYFSKGCDVLQDNAKRHFVAKWAVRDSKQNTQVPNISSTYKNNESAEYLNRTLFSEKDRKALQRIIDGWETLPTSVKRAILAIVKSANKRKITIH
jgi:hypothetical protein